jgi:hypothetical protein
MVAPFPEDAVLTGALPLRIAVVPTVAPRVAGLSAVGAF